MAKMHFKKQQQHKNNKKKNQQNHHNPTETKLSFYSLLDIENQQLDTYHIAHIKNGLLLMHSFCISNHKSP